jgi:hypothetical protein
MKFLPLFGLVCMLLLVSAFAVQASTSTGIIIDGDPSDWISAGLSPVGTDPPYNLRHSYNPVCTDLLEAWACKNETMLFLMMKVRGGAPDFQAGFYSVLIDVDPGGNTGDRLGYDYFVAQTSSDGAYLFSWNKTTLTWDQPSNSKVTGKAGVLGYIEWGVPLNEIGGNASSLKLDFYTFDNIHSETVNDITVTLSPPVTIPEFPFTFMLTPLLAAVIVVVAFFRRFQRAQRSPNTK